MAGLEHLTSLWQLYLGNEHIEDVTPLAGLTNLRRLNLDGNQIVDVTPLAGLTNLHFLDIENNRIEDLAPLTANPGLGEDDTVRLKNNPLTDQALNEQIPTLEARGVTVHY